MNNECIGCFLDPLYSPICFFREKNIVEKCPCVNCLVKVMCTSWCEQTNIKKIEKPKRLQLK